MTDIILKDLLNILQVRYRDIGIVDQNIKESIAVAHKDQDQLQIQNNCGEMHESINEQSVTHEIDEQASSQVVERTVIDEIDNVMGDDYVEFPICDEGAVSGVIQCEECWMWLKIKWVKYPIQAPSYVSVVMTKNFMKIWWSRMIHTQPHLK